ncbi:MAG: hypothetical protein Ct9H300mP8_12560 [Gammaproteobacteria bacterium]|nr:MAG: hypothetical protein Ct9H300mP8_12560 [Gammaproteobacteria bacterium]
MIGNENWGETRGMALEYKLRLPLESEALPGRAEAVPVPPSHFVQGRPLEPPFPRQMELLVVGMGCFWGAERLFWQIDGVYKTRGGVCGWAHAKSDVRRGLFWPHRTYRRVLAVYDPPG